MFTQAYSISSSYSVAMSQTADEGCFGHTSTPGHEMNCLFQIPNLYSGVYSSETGSLLTWLKLTGIKSKECSCFGEVGASFSFHTIRAQAIALPSLLTVAASLITRSSTIKQPLPFAAQISYLFNILHVPDEENIHYP